MIKAAALSARAKKKKKTFYKILPATTAATTADHLCQSWQSCSIHHEIQTMTNPDKITLGLT